MPPTNDFVPFCNENTGTNLPTQGAYLSNPALPIGNQPGVASSSLNNKAHRQATTIAAILAQFTTNEIGADMLDNQNSADHSIPAALLGALTATLKRHAPVITPYLTGTGNHNLTYKFQIASGNATAGATYSDGTTTYTVKTTITAATQVDASGAAVPATVSGTLTKTGGTGDATLTYYAYRKPLFLRVRGIGGGGGGGGSGTSSSGGTGGTGGTTTFGSSLLSALGGTGAAGYVPGTGGAISIGSATDIASRNGVGGAAGAFNLANNGGALGAPTPFGGGGSGGAAGGNPGLGALANTGSGGGGGATVAAASSGGGGGSGAYFDVMITSPLSTYAYAIGGGGSVGAAGTSGNAGGLGATGCVIVEELYQ